MQGIFFSFAVPVKNDCCILFAAFFSLPRLIFHRFFGAVLQKKDV